MKNVFSLFGLFLGLNGLLAQENNYNTARPDGHAPINIMGEHPHKKAEWMLSYNLMDMQMNGNGKDTNRISNDEIFTEYDNVAQKMTMQMHMASVMYSPVNKLTLMAMGSYSKYQMNMLSADGMSYHHKNEGWDNISFSVLYMVYNKNRSAITPSIGLTIPVGDIGVKEYHAGHAHHYPYNMQLGVNYALDLGISYVGQKSDFSWGVQPKGMIRMGLNDNNYRLGNLYSLNTWLGYKTFSWLSFSTRIKASTWGSISGKDQKLHVDNMPDANTENSGGSKIETGLGANIYIPNGTLKGLRLGTEFAIPIIQNYNGIQMNESNTSSVGLQYTIH